MLTLDALFTNPELPEMFSGLLVGDHPWSPLVHLNSALESVSANEQGHVHPSAEIEGAVFVAAGASVGPGAFVQGPAWIGPDAEVGHGALVRGGVILARGAKVGHASEIKHAVLLEDAKAPHFNYVGDSIVGARVNLGAGVKLANFRADGAEVKVDGEPTGLRKFGAILGDDVSIGCNAVTSPGTIVGAGSMIYPGASVRGVFAAGTVIKRPFDTPDV